MVTGWLVFGSFWPGNFWTKNLRKLLEISVKTCATIFRNSRSFYKFLAGTRNLLKVRGSNDNNALRWYTAFAWITTTTTTTINAMDPPPQCATGFHCADPNLLFLHPTNVATTFEHSSQVVYEMNWIQSIEDKFATSYESAGWMSRDACLLCIIQGVIEELAAAAPHTLCCWRPPLLCSAWWACVLTTSQKHSQNFPKTFQKLFRNFWNFWKFAVAFGKVEISKHYWKWLLSTSLEREDV